MVYLQRNKYTASPLTTGTYIDPHAGGRSECAPNGVYGLHPSSSWKQHCASCPPCVVNRMSVRNAIRDTSYPGSNLERYPLRRDHVPFGKLHGKSTTFLHGKSTTFRAVWMPIKKV